MPFTPVLPDGGIFLTLLIAPFTAGTLCGLTGSGSAIVIQVMFRLFHSLFNLQVADNESDESRRILAIAAVLSLTQYPVAVWRLYNSKERHIRWDAVLYLFPGLNILVWVGTFIAVHWPPGVLLYILGVTLIAIALWQFALQSIIGRKVDDEQAKVATRRHLNQKRQTMLVSGNNNTNYRDSDSGNKDNTTNSDNNNNNIDPNSTNTDSTTTPSTTIQPPSPSQSTFVTSAAPHRVSDGTSLDDLETMGDVAPKLPHSLKAPNPSFDLSAYSDRNGLDLTLPKNHNMTGLDSIDEGDEGSRGKSKSSKKNNRNYGQKFNISKTYGNNNDNNNLAGSSNPHSQLQPHNNTHNSDSALDYDDYAMITMGDDEYLSHRNDDRSFYLKLYDDAKNNPQTLIVGLVSGCVAGLLGGMMGINGPPVILFLFYLKLNGAQLRDTSMLVFFTNLPCLLLSRLIFSVFHLEEWLFYLIAIAASTTGLFLGTYFHSYCDTRLIMTCLQVVILLSSITLTKPGTGTPTAITFLVIYFVIAFAALGFIGWRIARTRAIKEKTKQQFYTLHGGREENEGSSGIAF